MEGGGGTDGCKQTSCTHTGVSEPVPVQPRSPCVEEHVKWMAFGSSILGA